MRSAGSQSYIVWTLFVALFSYLLIRTVYLPIQHDESATFFYYIQTGSFLPPDVHWDANNHILNSFLSYCCYKLLGNEPWILRLPNLLAFVLYFWAAWGVAVTIKKSFIKWGFFLSLVMAHYLFEYFGQTRGYGLSMALLMAGTFFLLRFLKHPGKWLFALVIFTLFLATSANLTLLTPSFLMIFYVLIVALLSEKSVKSYCVTIGLFLSSLLLFYPLIWYSFELKTRGALYYGGTSGFWEYTGQSLSTYFIGSYADWMAVVYTLLICGLLAGLLFLIVKANGYRKQLLHRPSFFFSYLFVGAIAAIFAMRYLLHVNFPEDRAALYLFPFLMFMFTFVINDAIVSGIKNASWCILPLVYFPIHFIAHINISTTIFPMSENPPAAFFDRFSKEKNPAELPSIGGYKMQRLCWAYMNHQRGGHYSQMLVSDQVDTICDYQIVDISRKLPTNFRTLYTQVNAVPDNNLNLYRRSIPLTRKLISRQDTISNWNHSNEEFFNLFSFELPDSLKGCPVFVCITATIDAHAAPFVASVVVSQKDKTGKELNQENIHLDWLKKTWNNQPGNLHHGIVVPYTHPDASQLIVYLWNQKKMPFLLHNGKVELFVLK